MRYEGSQDICHKLFNNEDGVGGGRKGRRGSIPETLSQCWDEEAEL